ncbi:MAG: AsmA family protein [Spirochaetes bacterium]|nr:AsmA family protein [Spirochaetota bacterium]
MKKQVKPVKKSSQKKVIPAKKSKSSSKLLKALAVLFGAFVLLFAGILIAVYIIVDKDFVESQLENVLHRQVRVAAFDSSIFSAVSGIEVKEVKVSNFKTEEQLKSLKGKPVAENDVFAALGSFKFKLSIPPLLKKQFVLNEVMLYSAKINIIRYKNGMFNFSDLLVPAKKDKSEKEVSPEEKPKDSAPVKADDLPVAVNIGSVGLQDAQINFYDQATGQSLMLYKVTAKVHDIVVDPKDLSNKDNAMFIISGGIKTVSRPKSGSVESFDIGFEVTGNAVPFDKSTRILNPEINLRAGSPYGTITGLQIFNEMINVEQLSKYSGKFDFLKKEINWKNGFVSAHYKNNVVSFKDGKIANDDYTLLFNGNMNIATSVVDIDADLSIAKKHSETVKKRIEALASKAIKGKVAKFVTPAKIADIALKPLLNEKGEIFLKEKIKGDVAKPNADLVSPKLSSIDDVIKDAVKEAGGEVIDAAKDKAKDKAKKEATKQTDKAKSKAGSKIKGLIK